MRTFIALELPAPFIDEAAALARGLKRAVDGRFLPRDSYHLTLAFLGDIDEAQSRDAIDAIDSACGALSPARLHADGLGKFGRVGDATLWLSLAADPTLTALAEAVRAQLDDRGLSFDAKPFRPHITLARRARLPKGALPPLAFPADAQADAVTLFKSTLSADGASYKALYRAHLANAANIPMQGEDA